MEPEKFCEIGELLFGPHWMQPMADALKVNKRTIQRWTVGRFVIPADMPIRLSSLIERHMEKLMMAQGQMIALAASNIDAA